MTKDADQSDRKQVYFAKLIDLLNRHHKILLVGADNVGSNHMQGIRRNLRGHAELLMGKNTMIRKAIKGHLAQNPHLEVLLPHIVGNVGFVFTDGDLKTIRDQVKNNTLSAPARVGSLAPIDVYLPAGNTSLDPSQTNFMQALNIATRINKGQIEIINQVHLIKKGEKVGGSEAAILQKLDIKPFFYGLLPVMVYEHGMIFNPELLDITDDQILDKFRHGVSRVAALSLKTNLPTLAAVPHYLARAYQNIAAISLATEYTFPRIATLKELLSNPEAMAAAAAEILANISSPHTTSTTTPVETKKEEKKEEPPAEEEDDAGFGDLFG